MLKSRRKLYRKEMSFLDNYAVLSKLCLYRCLRFFEGFLPFIKESFLLFYLLRSRVEDLACCCFSEFFFCNFINFSSAISCNGIQMIIELLIADIELELTLSIQRNQRFP